MGKWLSNRDFVGGTILLIFATWFYITAQAIPNGNYPGMQPSFFPSFLGVILAFLSLFVVGNGVKEVLQNKETEYEKKDHKTVLILVLMLALYIVILKYLGFIITTVLYLIAVMSLLKAGKPAKIIPIAVIISLAVYFIFGMGFKVPLP